MHMGVLRSMGKGAGLGSGAELEPRSPSLPSPQAFPEPLVGDVG